jgi:ribonuclease E
MKKKMLIDATHEEETRVAVVDENRLIDFDYESKLRKQLKGSVFLAKVTRVEPSLQAAFVNFGGNRHGFLPFSEIHPDYFRIPVADRQAILKEQQEEMEARQAEEDADEDEESNEGPGNAEADNLDDDDEDFVEEVGGDDVVDLDEGDLEESEEVQSTEGQDESKLSENSQEDSEALESNDDSEKNADSDSQEQPEAQVNSEEKRAEEGNYSNRRRRGRRRYYNKKRGGRGRSMASDSRRVEVVGGDELEGDRPIRPSIKRDYKIQEVVKRGQIMLIQASKEERGNKGAAVTTYMSLPGRYCVLMPNSPRAGGVSRKIANYKDRKRMRDILKELNVPEGMSVIMRTAGVERTKTEIKRDLDYLLRLWNSMRELTLQSTAPSLIHEESNLIRRAIRDIYTRDIEEVIVSGDKGYKIAKDFMKMMIPSHARRVKEYKDEQIPLFNRYQVEAQINDIGDHVVTLPSGGYLVINPTEALISIDVNSGRATRERHIEETALKTNLEAAEEVARQLKLRDLGGLVVIDFIDMEDRRNNRKVENKVKGALSSDRARIQIGRISSFGLMELSRQRLNPSLTDSQFKQCSHCKGAGYVRTIDSAAILALRALEDEGIKSRSAEVKLSVPNEVALYILNQKRDALIEIEKRYNFKVTVVSDDTYLPSGFQVEVQKAPSKRKGAKSSDDNQDKNEKPNKQKGGRRRGKRGGRRRNVSEQQGGDKFDSKDQSAQDTDTELKQDMSAKELKRDDKKMASKKRRPRKKKEEQLDKQDITEAAISESESSAVELSVVEDSVAESGSKPEQKKSRKGTKKTEKKSNKKEVKGDKKKSGAKKKPRSDKGKKSSDKKEVSESSESKAIEASNDVEAHAKDFETVNEAPSKKKRGWWSKDSD